ncbi:maltokinase N-terminal cap-like domain-containing protein [Tessaracoccus sp. Y36]
MSGAAEVHVGAELRPTKIELLQGWLPRQHWFFGDAGRLERVANFRLADPDGEVGLDSMVISDGVHAYFVPVTWRAAPLDGGDLIGTLEHSVLGTRYCYDAATDPVFMAELERVIREADGQADVHDHDGNVLPLVMDVHGSGVVPGEGSDAELELVRVLERSADVPGDALGTLIADWTDDAGPRHDLLALLR